MKSNISIDIYSDNICPWCYIGLNKLKLAISEFPNAKFNLIWRPFQLNPNMPKEGMDRQKYLNDKFNGKENVKKVYDQINKAGLDNNIHFQFQKILITPNSFISHKLLALAYKYDKQTEVVETLFYDYFIEGIDIGNLDEIVRIAKQHNIYDKFTYKYIQSNEDNQNLLEEEKQARALGIQGVPCYIINKKFVLFGSQDKISFLDIFIKLTKDD
jgi:predicted DsbA family dithiol-disulfide isomerase